MGGAVTTIMPAVDTLVNSGPKSSQDKTAEIQHKRISVQKAYCHKLWSWMKGIMNTGESEYIPNLIETIYSSMFLQSLFNSREL